MHLSYTHSTKNQKGRESKSPKKKIGRASYIRIFISVRSQPKLDFACILMNQYAQLWTKKKKLNGMTTIGTQTNQYTHVL